MTRRQFDLHPDELPDTYVMTGDGTCMEPEIMDGTKLLFSRTERYKHGDAVALFRRREFTAPGEHQILIKKLIYAPRSEYWTDPANFRGGNIVPMVLVEMLNPRAILQFHPDSLLGIHKCLGPVPVGHKTHKISDDELRQLAAGKRNRIHEPSL
ncbi:S24 family peptidase [Rhizobium sp. BK602]|uniref:S24 family peptidase n=1 Tax=Rhizobium sp. BK602 TaxID=2586986 RepID=UPI00161DBF1E|nr:S24 family peptidase [Rhizobium sp. BK602]MBB3610955.1 hypothetical protein [Rhizobium sp. BK602]